MKLSYKQLSRYLPITLDAEKIAEILTLTGLEVEDISRFESIKGGLSGIVVGKVIEKIKHPDADRLSVTKVDVGAEEALQIVCGAPNVEAGQTVLVATVNTTLYPTSGEAFQIKKSKIRGVESHGMICAEDEIGLGQGHDGIMILPDHIEAGTQAADYFGINTDTVIEINITPNRPDAACHIGAARDILAFLGVEQEVEPLRIPNVQGFQMPDKLSPISVSLESKDCIRYSGLHLTNIKVGESPEWLKNFLLAVGLRPINNVVDITNFVLMETGQPLHAFDAAKLKDNKIVVRHAKPEEQLITLDNISRKLNPSNLLICDSEKALCIAGVMGGLDSGTGNNTVEIFLESACFAPASVRKTSKEQGLKTDSSFRFERGTDPEATVYALKRAALLMQEYCDTQIESSIIDIYPNVLEKREIRVRKEKISAVSGIDIPHDICRKIWSGLGIAVLEESEDSFLVHVPLFKVDVTREIDLIEELLRVYGLNKVPLNKHISYSPGIQGERDALKLYKNIAGYMAAQGFNEILTNSLSYSKYAALQQNTPESGWIKVLNPISSELDIMRPEMLFSGLEVVAVNKNHKWNNIRIFEIGKTYIKHPEEKDQFIEKEKLSIWISGDDRDESWMQGSKPGDFYHIKNKVDGLLDHLGVECSVQSKLPIPDYFAYGVALAIKNTVLGYIGKVKENIATQMGIKAEVFYAEMDMAVLKNNHFKKKIRYTEIPKYPSVRRDLALLVDIKTEYSELEQWAKKKAGPLLQEVNLFDVYEGKNLPPNTRSYALSFIFMSREATLRDEVIDATMQQLIGGFETELGAKLR